MKRIVSVLAIVVVLLPFAASGEEGMWRPKQLPDLAKELVAMGLEADPASLSDLMSHPMNAVIWLGGCTASFVSPDGLAVTNHHCAYGSIQHNSTKENNLLEKGFIAKELADELPAAPGSRIRVTVEVTDVTDKVVSAVPKGATGRERYQALDDQKKALIAECEKDPGHRCSVRGYYGGSEYELIKQLEIRDVRLVHAPPGPIGKYGGDIDNWMWPRHTGDYSFYRAYVGPDGKPADFSEDNIPFRPKHYLKVSTEGVQPGDFVMAVGYPGRTNRYRLATEVENVIQWYYPTRRKAYLEWLDLIEEATAENEEAEIKYAGLVAGLNNSSKNYDGMLNGFSKSDIVERKSALERELQAWIEGDPDRKAKFQSALENLRKLIAESHATQERDLFYSFLARRSSLLGAARTLYRLSQEKQKPDMEREAGYQERDFVRIKEGLDRIERTYEPSVDRACWRQFILNYAKLPADQHVPAFDAWFGIEGNTVNEAKLDGMLDEMYANTKLGDKETRLSLMESTPADLEKSEDPFIKMAVHLYESDLKMENEAKDLVGRFDEVRPKFMEAVVAYYDSQGRAVYPDANSTLRVTYGKVKGYSPKDALTYTPFTTLRGILEKDTGEDPFNAPADQLEWIRDKDYGRFYDKALDSVPVNFLSTLDSTGGNSGSPTMNGKGELVGLLFDGNWESIIADWDFIPAITRTIIVDMRYVLWIMERTEHAGRLLQEMSVAAETTDSEN
jgi:hypothetical protein